MSVNFYEIYLKPHDVDRAVNINENKENDLIYLKKITIL